MTKIEKIRSLHQFFLTTFKPKKKVVLRFSDQMKDNGAYSYTTGKHYITIKKKDNYFTCIDSLNHEWAHLLEHSKYGDVDSHTDAWGKKYAKVFRTYLLWLSE